VTRAGLVAPAAQAQPTQPRVATGACAERAGRAVRCPRPSGAPCWHTLSVVVNSMQNALLLCSTLASATAKGLTPTGEARRDIAQILSQLHGEEPPERMGIRWLFSHGARWLFNHDDGAHGAELWTSDLTPFGTQLVKDIHPGPSDSYPHGFAEYQGAVYFAAFDGTHGVELWRTDGTSEGTALALDINPGDASSHVSMLTACADHLFFGARDPDHGFEMRALDASGEGGARLLQDTTPGGHDSAISMVECKTSTNGEQLLFWRVGRAEHAVEMVSDGRADGTRRVASEGKAEL
jgi:ELWxxDGT repeat protein